MSTTTHHVRKVVHRFGPPGGRTRSQQEREAVCTAWRPWRGSSFGPTVEQVFHQNAVGNDDGWHCVGCGHAEGAS